MSVAPEPAPRVSRGMWKRFAVGIFAMVVLAGGATATAGLLEVQNIVDDLNLGRSIKAGKGVITPAEAGAPQTILVLGSDKRYRSNGPRDARSDTIMLLRLNADAPGTTVLNIPRDLKVAIPRGKGVVQTDKINAAYAVGGPVLTAKVVKRLLGIRINHIINVNFGGFRRAIDYLGCVYADIDRRYFNDNAGVAPTQGYATINIQPGYQKMCGQDSLDYVRFRHLDTDIVRSARQQDFLSQVRQQYGASAIVSNRDQLARIFGRYTQSDEQLHSKEAVLKLMQLVAFSAQNPVITVPFPAILPTDPKDPYVTAQPAAIRRAVRVFLGQARPGSAARGGRRSARRGAPRTRQGSAGGANLVLDVAGGQQQAAALRGVGMPVYYPRLREPRGVYQGIVPATYPRAYRIHDKRGRLHPAYRITVAASYLGSGQYYGIQGMTWMSPPILRDVSEYRQIGRRKLELHYDGHKLRVVAWRTRRAVYWVSNSLNLVLTNKQMLGIAASLTPAGR